MDGKTMGLQRNEWLLVLLLVGGIIVAVSIAMVIIRLAE
jgi:hypothetical protein